jgi:hypothetical protein
MAGVTIDMTVPESGTRVRLHSGSLSFCEALQ